MMQIKDFGKSFDDTIIKKCLYEYRGNEVSRKYTSIGAVIDANVQRLLENLCYEYTKKLDILGAPIRMDLGISNSLQLVPFEINTGFVDQFGAGINLLEATDTENYTRALESMGKMRSWENILLMQNEYRKEMELMQKYVEKATGQMISDISLEKAILSEENTFCYGYPNQEIVAETSIVPNIKLLNVESKSRFYEFLKNWGDRDNILNIPSWYNINNTPYSDIPREKYMFFKKDGPKIKGDRNTVLKTKIRNKPEMMCRYNSGEYLAQELYDPYILDQTGGTIEMRSLFLGDTKKYSMIVSYVLLGDDPKKGKLVNDSCPQGPVVVK